MADWFNLSEELQALQNDPYVVENEVGVDSMDLTEQTSTLNGAIDCITQSSENITDPQTFDTFRSFLKHAEHVKPQTVNKLLDAINSGLQAELDSTERDENSDDQNVYSSHRTALEMYAFLLQWFASVAEKNSNRAGNEAGSASVAMKSKRGKAALKAKAAEGWSWVGNIPGVLAVMSKALQVQSGRIWTTTPERDAYVACFTRTVWLISESEVYMKTADIKLGVYKVLCLAVKYHGQAFSVQTSIMQSLQYFEHLSEQMAELLTIMTKEFDYQQLTEEILREICGKTFTAVESKTPRSFSRFIVRLAELSPRPVLKQISLLQKHLDSESYPMRNAILEVLGILINELQQPETDGEGSAENRKRQVDAFFDLLFERFLDVNSYVRSKLVTVFIKICDLPTKFPKKRQHLTSLTIRSLEDKSSSVRKNSIALLTKLILTHPYGIMHGGELNLPEWEERCERVSKELDAVAVDLPPPDEEDGGDGDGEDDEDEDADGGNLRPDDDDDDEDEDDGAEDEDDNGEATPKPKKAKRASLTPKSRKKKGRKPQLDISFSASYHPEKAARLRLTKQYYVDAIRFIRQIEDAIPVLSQLLVSTSKAEVLESMEFFRVAHEYRIQSADVGVKKMLHLIWHKDNTIVEDGKELKGIRSRLIEVYRSLYFDPLPDLNEKENVNRIAKNMIDLTKGATLAELTSLQQFMSTMMADDLVHEDVVNTLWQVYSAPKQIPRVQRRGAIIILSMLAVARREVVVERIDVLLKIGLGPLGKNDLVLAKYTCIALQRLSGSVKKVKGSLTDDSLRLPMEHPIFHKLQEMIELSCSSREWLSMAENALQTVYALGEQPDVLCNQIIKNMAGKVFARSADDDDAAAAEESLSAAQPEIPEIFGTPRSEASYPSSASQFGYSLSSDGPEELGDAFQLSQLIFTVGHVALKHIVHLELVEREYKRRKAEFDKQKLLEKAPGDKGVTDELDQVAGNAEDEIGEVIATVREIELLYGPDSLLAVFGPMVVHICSSPKSYNNDILRTAATLTLCKFMCVSSQFCDENLLLLFRMLEKSDDPTVRSNIVIALGDMAICFGSIIDENSDRLYAGLTDKDLGVKKNTLMVLTHLILNGMIKVKGQLGEMAKCLEDEEERVSDLAKLFFSELATKENAVYNNLPDIISHLSVGQHAVDEEAFNRTMKFIFTFIDKEKQAENVVEKLCARFRLVEGERQWRDIAFCLSLLPYKSERSIKKLIEGLPFYQDKLREETVYRRFTEILAKARASKGTKPDSDLKEFEEILEKYKKQGEADQETENNITAQVAKAQRRTGRRAAQRGSQSVSAAA